MKLLSIFACTHACISVPFVFLKTSAPLSGARRGERRNVTVSVLMWNPFHVKFSFSDDKFSKPTANLEMFLISPLSRSSVIVASNGSGMRVIEPGFLAFSLGILNQNEVINLTGVLRGKSVCVFWGRAGPTC